MYALSDFYNVFLLSQLPMEQTGAAVWAKYLLESKKAGRLVNQRPAQMMNIVLE